MAVWEKMPKTENFTLFRMKGKTGFYKYTSFPSCVPRVGRAESLPFPTREQEECAVFSKTGKD